MFIKANLVLLVGLGLGVVGCDGGGSGDAGASATPTMGAKVEVPPKTDELAGLKERVVTHHADIVFATYADALAAAEELRAAIGQLVASPSAETMEAARVAWRESRLPYLQTEGFRFYGGPVDEIEGMINAWPMDESYVDYVDGNPEAGVINSPEEYPEISAAVLGELNEKDGETNISTGYHAIEFLLWGQDLSADGAGERGFEDYASAKNASRRGEYLVELGNLLVGHLQSLVAAWDPAVAGNFREDFLEMPRDEALHDIFTGIGVLSGFEMSGERLAVAYVTQAQEDEHSCFSDNTHVDMIEDARGVRNVYTGKYVRTDGSVVEGPGLDELVAAKDGELAARLGREVDATVAAAEALPVPFDQAILGEDDAAGRLAVATLIDDLRTQGATIVEAAKEFGLTIQLDGD